MNNSMRVLVYLQSISPNEASNSQIETATGIHPHQQIYQITSKLLLAGKISGRRINGEWYFSAPGGASTEAQPEAMPVESELDSHSSFGFEILARKILSQHYGVELEPGYVSGIPKEFDLVSSDQSIIGDAKYYTRVRGKGLPPAKFATVAEYVWLLEKIPAREKFLVFGNDRNVPILWLAKHRHLCQGIKFFFLTDDGELELL